MKDNTYISRGLVTKDATISVDQLERVDDEWTKDLILLMAAPQNFKAYCCCSDWLDMRVRLLDW